MIPTSLLFRTPPELEFASSAKPQLIKPPPHVTQRFTSLVRRFLAAAESRPQLLSSPVAVESFQIELLVAAKALLTNNEHATGLHFVRWRRQAKSAVDLAIKDPDSSLSISELARKNGVPERTLRTAFQRCFGLSPVAYLRILRSASSPATSSCELSRSDDGHPNWLRAGFSGISGGSPVPIANCSGNFPLRRCVSPVGHPSECGIPSRPRKPPRKPTEGSSHVLGASHQPSAATTTHLRRSIPPSGADTSPQARSSESATSNRPPASSSRSTSW